ncbi:MAG: J domain-containing protein [Gammaproteobacteria bacterium]|nr:J domain-containing protein [Gammaproteobacteria bacterium]
MAGKKAFEQYQADDHDFDQNSDASENSDHGECDCDDCRATYNESDAPCTNPNCTECGQQPSSELPSVPSIEVLTAADIEAIQNAYDLVGLERIASIKQLKKAITKALLEHHPDRTAKTTHAKGSEEKTKQLNAAMESVNSLLRSPQKAQLYRLFQNSSFALLSRHPQFSKEIFRYHLTFTFYKNGQEMKMLPSPVGLENFPPLIQNNIAVFINLLFPAIQKIDQKFLPTVLRGEHDDLTVITAENYTTSELLVLFKLVVSGEYRLPYPLRYKKDVKTLVDPMLNSIFTRQGQPAMVEYINKNLTKESAAQSLHRLLTLAINLELANRDYYDYAIDEVSSVEYIRNVTEWLWVAAAVSCFGGAIYYWILHDLLLITLPLVIYSSLVFMIAIPVVLCLVALLWGYFPVKNFNTFIANTSAMISEYFFLNCWSGDIQFNNLAFLKSLYLSESALNALPVENTAEKSFQKAEFTYGESAGNFVGSFFGSSARSNKYVSLVEHPEDSNSISFGMAANSINNVD